MPSKCVLVSAAVTRLLTWYTVDTSSTRVCEGNRLWCCSQRHHHIRNTRFLSHFCDQVADSDWYAAHEYSRRVIITVLKLSDGGTLLSCGAVSVCVSVRLSVTFVDSAETNKHIFKLFHHRVATPVFAYQTSWQYSDGDPPQRGLRMQRWYNKITIFD